MLGSPLGEMLVLGRSDGCDGFIVGEDDGSMLGDCEGSCVGFPGVTLGFALGMLLGIDDGPTEGTVLG